MLNLLSAPRKFLYHNFRLMVTTAHTGTFTYAPFRLPLLPTAPALAPAAGAGPGGLEGELAGPDLPGPGDAGVQETPEVASLGTAAAGVHRVGRCMMGIGLSPALLGPRAWSPDHAGLLAVRESLTRPRSCDPLLAAAMPHAAGRGV